MKPRWHRRHAAAVKSFFAFGNHAAAHVTIANYPAHVRQHVRSACRKDTTTVGKTIVAGLRRTGTQPHIATVHKDDGRLFTVHFCEGTHPNERFEDFALKN